MSISTELCDAVLRAAAEEASTIGVPMNVAILDEACHLKAFVRMDGALLGSIDIAIKKARTSSLFGMTSEDVGEFCKPGGSSPGLEQTNGGLVVFAGGIPLRNSAGALIGSVGVSGGSVDQDQRVAVSAASVLDNQQRNARWQDHAGQAPFA